MAGPAPPSFGGPLVDESNARTQKQQLGLAALAGYEIPVPRRRAPLILPTDDDWKRVEGFFIEILRIPSVTTGAILSAFFDDHDRTIFVPVTTPPTRVDVQKDHTRRYKINLATRFRGHTLTLATKFAMLYFGLPVEPLLSEAWDPMQHIVEETDDSGLTSVIVTPPLHFLTAHDQRNFGIDSKRGREARFSTVPVLRSTLSKPHVEDDYADEEFVLGLRGGDLDECLDDASDEEPDLGLRGGEMGDDFVDTAPSGSKTNQEDVEMGDGEDVVPVVHNPAIRTQFNPHILGYQGRCEVSFKDYYGVFDAIRSLLSIQPEVTTDIVLHKIEGDKITATWTFPDPVTAYHDAIVCIQQHTTTVNPEFFIHRVGEQPPEKGRFKPSLREDDVFRLHCISRDRTFREAYLRLPPKKWFHREGPLNRYGANEYMKYVLTAQSVLFGQPRFHGDFAHSMIHLEGYTHGSDELAALARAPSPHQMTSWPASYGGFEIDKGFLDFAHLSNEDGPLSAMVRRRDLGQNQIALIIPGAKISELIIDTPLQEAQGAIVLEKIRGFFLEVGGLESLLIHHGRNFYSSVPPPPYRWRPFARTGEEGGPSDAEVLQHLCDTVKENPKIGRYFVLQPVYASQPKICYPGKEKSADSLDDALTSMDRLHEMLVRTDYPVEYGFQERLPDNCPTILLRQLGDSAHWNLTSYTVFRTSTAEEMHQIRRFISTPNVHIEVILAGVRRCSSWAQGLFATSQSLFGPRYGFIDASDRKNMELKPLLEHNDPWLTKLRNAWKKKREADAAAAKASVEAQRREAEQRKEPTGAAGDSVPKQWEKQDTFKKHLPKKDLRMQSWSRPQSLYDGDGDFHPYIPLNSAPIESMLRVSKGQSVPMVSKSVLTPTEQRDLQVQVHALRNLNLTRIHICQYQGCNFQCRADDAKALLDHQETHVKYRCPWCPDTLFQHFHDKSRDKHFKEKHADKLASLAVQAEAEGLDKNDLLYTLRQKYVAPKVNREPNDPRSALWTAYSRTAQRPGGEPVIPYAPAKAHAWEKEYSHCDRCGRNHGFLDDKRDRAHHDRRCVPHAKGAGVCGFCKSCGEREWATEEEAKKWQAGVEFPHRCYGFVHHGAPHCEKCGLSLKSMTDAYIDKHREHCMGYGSMVASFCPYCADALNPLHPDQADPKMWLEHKKLHLTACRRSLRPEPNQRFYAGDMTPFDLYDKQYWAGPEPPHDDLWNGPLVYDRESFYTSGFHRPSKYLGEKLEWYEMVGEKGFTDPPKKCPVDGCVQTLDRTLPNGILNHFEEAHGGPLKMCPFCSLSFKVPAEHMVEGGDRYERLFQEKHMECHIFSLWDIRDGKKEKPKYNDVGKLRNKSSDPAKCPFFEGCGAIITHMSDDQWETHLLRMHPSKRPAAPESWPVGQPPRKKPATQQPTPRQLKTQLPTPQTVGTSAQHDVQPVKGGFRLKSPPPPPADPEEEDEEEERRSWLRLIIGDVTVPNELYRFLKAGEGSYHCSRCFRPFPRGHWREDPGTDDQLAAHLDINNRSCCIPNVVGEAMRDGKVILPNQSGWIHRDSVPKDFDWEAHAKKWIEKFPAYERTMFKFDGMKKRKWNKWSHDPNRKQNKKYHGLPFPPPGYDPLKPPAPALRFMPMRELKPKRTVAPRRSETLKEIQAANEAAAAALAAAVHGSDDGEQEEEEEGEEEDNEYVHVGENDDEDEGEDDGEGGGDGEGEEEGDGQGEEEGEEGEEEEEVEEGEEEEEGEEGEEEEESEEFEEEEGEDEGEEDEEGADDAAADPPMGSGRKGTSKKDSTPKKGTRKRTASEQAEETETDSDDNDDDDNDDNAGAAVAVAAPNQTKRRRWRPITYKGGRRKGPPRGWVDDRENDDYVDNADAAAAAADNDDNADAAVADNDDNADAADDAVAANQKKRRRWRPITYKGGRRKGPPRSAVAHTSLSEEESESDSDSSPDADDLLNHLAAHDPAAAAEFRRRRKRKVKGRPRVKDSTYVDGNSPSSSDSDINSQLTEEEEDEIPELRQMLTDRGLDPDRLGKRKRGGQKRGPTAKMAVMGDGSELLGGEEELVEGERSPKRSRTASE